MLLTWVLTVFSLMTSLLGDLAVVQPCGDQAEHLELALRQIVRRRERWAGRLPAAPLVAATADISVRAMSGCNCTLPR